MLSHKLVHYWARKAAEVVKTSMRRFALFQRLWAVCSGLRGQNYRLSASPIGGDCEAIDRIVMGGVLPHKLVQYWARKAAEVVKTSMGQLAVFQRLWAVCRGLRGQN